MHLTKENYTQREVVRMFYGELAHAIKKYNKYLASRVVLYHNIHVPLATAQFAAMRELLDKYFPLKGDVHTTRMSDAVFCMCFVSLNLDGDLVKKSAIKKMVGDVNLDYHVRSLKDRGFIINIGRKFSLSHEGKEAMKRYSSIVKKWEKETTLHKVSFGKGNYRKMSYSTWSYLNTIFAKEKMENIILLKLENEKLKKEIEQLKQNKK